MPATPTRIAITCEGPAVSDPVDPWFGKAGEAAEPFKAGRLAFSDAPGE
ncbi:hypothetical protein [Mesoterricola silvestris]|uniref:Uncharacterized protein n=1 Tax=Mesoterricola silvestris TaxID=2927979 RepID=A0AA48GX85_9BACT|nr:hypothetical protein [Mesoterricola silvestris]BDU73546.1 hypothetical protein METEAL_27200 [Mesoterricola silvestris]